MYQSDITLASDGQGRDQPSRALCGIIKFLVSSAPAVSIDAVIPVRNGATTIARAVDSVLAQTRLPDRVLVVDDGSTDGGADLVRGLARVEVITTPPRGVSHARNTGIHASQADLVAFLDCDDFWLPEKIQCQMTVFERDPEIVAVNSAFMTADRDGRRIEGGAVPVPFRRDAHRQLLELFHGGGGGSSTIMARRAVLLELGGYDERLAFGEDRDMWLRLAHGRALGYCPEVLAAVVENPSSVTRRGMTDPTTRVEMLLQNLQVMEKWTSATPLPARFYINCCSEILVQSVRNRLGYRGLRALRVQLEERVPTIARRIARSDAGFLTHLALSGVLNAPVVFGRYLTYRRRRSRAAAHFQSARGGAR